MATGSPQLHRVEERLAEHEELEERARRLAGDAEWLPDDEDAR